MKTYRLKLTAITPIHIGTGEVYEPTNFIIDDGYLYEFDEVLFLKSLSKLEQQSFNSKLQDYIQIIDFYKNHKDKAKKIYKHRVEVTKKVEDKYQTTRNKDGSKNKNQLEIQKTYKNPNNNFLVIPGSSLKGVFDTFLTIYPPKKNNEVRQQLQLSDALVINSDPKIGFCYRRHKDLSKSARSSIPQIVEIIPNNTAFISTIKSKYSFNELKQLAKKYFANRVDSKYSEDKNSFVIRVGKFSGKNYVSDEKDVKNSYGKPVATHTLYEDNSSFGWLKVELISEDEHKTYLNTISKKESQYYNDLENRLKEIKEYIKIEKQKQLEARLKKEQEAKEEQQRKEQEARKREQILASMSIFEKKLYELEQNNIANIPKETLLLKAIKENYFQDRKEALIYLKEYMQQNNLWVEVSKKKNPKKDRNHQRTLEVKELLEAV
jgi:CRISPR/Cas system CSM-associated protein Csm5 (group 7 of RAMP superfamily)